MPDRSRCSRDAGLWSLHYGARAGVCSSPLLFLVALAVSACAPSASTLKSAAATPPAKQLVVPATAPLAPTNQVTPAAPSDAGSTGTSIQPPLRAAPAKLATTPPPIARPQGTPSPAPAPSSTVAYHATRIQAQVGAEACAVVGVCRVIVGVADLSLDAPGGNHAVAGACGSGTVTLMDAMGQSQGAIPWQGCTTGYYPQPNYPGPGLAIAFSRPVGKFRIVGNLRYDGLSVSIDTTLPRN